MLNISSNVSAFNYCVIENIFINQSFVVLNFLEIDCANQEQFFAYFSTLDRDNVFLIFNRTSRMA